METTTTNISAVPETATIKMCERSPVKITLAEWPIIARASDIGDGFIEVRRHADGRVIVHGTGPNAHAGFYLKSDEPSSEIPRSIRRVAGILASPTLARACIEALPPEVL